jgi:hypothetical protein
LRLIQALMEDASENQKALDSILVPIRILCLPRSPFVARCLGSINNAEQENRALTGFVSQLIILAGTFSYLSSSMAWLEAGLVSKQLEDSPFTIRLISDFETRRIADVNITVQFIINTYTFNVSHCVSVSNVLSVLVYSLLLVVFRPMSKCVRPYSAYLFPLCSPILQHMLALVQVIKKNIRMLH